VFGAAVNPELITTDSINKKGNRIKLRRPLIFHLSAICLRIFSTAVTERFTRAATFFQTTHKGSQRGINTDTIVLHRLGSDTIHDRLY
jgi:hypothetical protein